MVTPMTPRWPQWSRSDPNNLMVTPVMPSSVIPQWPQWPHNDPTVTPMIPQWPQWPHSGPSGSLGSPWHHWGYPGVIGVTVGSLGSLGSPWHHHGITGVTLGLLGPMGTVGSLVDPMVTPEFIGVTMGASMGLPWDYWGHCGITPWGWPHWHHCGHHGVNGVTMRSTWGHYRVIMGSPPCFTVGLWVTGKKGKVDKRKSRSKNMQHYLPCNISVLHEHLHSQT